MAPEAWPPRDPFAPSFAPDAARAPDEAPPTQAARGPGLGAVLGAVVAVLASAGLAWWFAAPQAPPQPPPPALVNPNAPPPRPAEAPAAPLRYAAAEPDPEQVRRAWRESRAAYVDGGPEALVRGSVSCAKTLPTEPQLLDYCVAYDIYASEIAGGDGSGAGDWFRDAAARDLALARTALPGGADPANRIAQLTALTKAVIPRPPARRPKPVRAAHAKTTAKAAHHRPGRAAVHKVRKRAPKNFPADIYPYTTLPDPPPETIDPPH